MGRGSTLSNNGVNREVGNTTCKKGPCVISGVSRGMSRASAKANEGANREAERDVGDTAWKGGAHGEASSSERGKLGGTQGTRRSDREGTEQRWEGSEGRGCQGRPVTLPLKEVAVFRQPFLNARVQDDKVVIEGCSMAAGMGRTLREEASKVVKGSCRGEG